MRAWYLGARNVHTCIRVVLCHTKNGLPSCLALSIKSVEALTSTSSKVVMSYLAFGVMSCMSGTLDMLVKGAKGPSSTLLCLPTTPQRGCSVVSSVSVAQQCTKLRGPTLSRYAASSGNEYQEGSDIASRWYRYPKNSSKPCTQGRYLFQSPRWFLPNCPVSYPNALSAVAGVIA